VFELTRAAPRACVPNLSGLPKNMLVIVPFFIQSPYFSCFFDPTNL